ncbi:hypothetical protein SEA_LISARA_37 [Arthrobacter phage LiSara]|uniref:Uncharacterized protein n=1 Tax=Arthrobacter phage LiSara TaxID=2015860 RepID=A0A222ZHF0_9CAUD|nr:hypothetical protein KMD21_gp37 [Arthrobacter phage LiSara]ASR83621.1 hypothetical protein SEA_LISARA_37 [Arthrobacter phage LiSara]
MPLSNATIESRGNGHGTITLDGADVSHLVGKVEFTSQPGKVDTLILHTHIAAKIEAKGVKVVLDEQTRNWLAALGWTPPVEGECPTTPHDCGDGEDLDLMAIALKIQAAVEASDPNEAELNGRTAIGLLRLAVDEADAHIVKVSENSKAAILSRFAENLKSLHSMQLHARA